MESVLKSHMHSAKFFQNKIAIASLLSLIFAGSLFGAIGAEARVSAPRKKTKPLSVGVEALQKKAFACYLQRNFVEAAKLFKQCLIRELP